MIVWLWSASGAECRGSGVSDSEERARGAAEACLASGRANVAHVEQALTALDATTLIYGYVRTGDGWQGHRGEHGAITWESLRQARAAARG